MRYKSGKLRVIFKYYNFLDCESYQTQCSNGLCVQTQYFCDGDNDCGEWNDEINCRKSSSN